MPEFRRVRLINPRRKTRSRSRRRARKANGRFVKRSAMRRTAPRRRTNPRRRRTTRAVIRRVSRPRARARKKNPLGEELILLSNPRRKKRTTNGRRRRRTTNPFQMATRRRRRSNPQRSFRRRRNPVTREGVKSFALEGVKAIAAGAVGSVGCRAIAQGILGDKNVGMMGYLANLGLALGGGFALFKFTKSKALALGWAVGGSAATVQRIWSEKVSMTSPAAAAPALGDLDYSSNGMGGVGLSGYIDTGYALPSVTGQDGRIQPAFQPQLPAVAAAAGSAPQPVGVAQRYAPRY
jgi:hypothetical protein